MLSAQQLNLLSPTMFCDGGRNLRDDWVSYKTKTIWTAIYDQDLYNLGDQRS